MDSDFTFFRGSLKSQNDWCATNNTHSIQSFCILPKLELSDHRPCAITLRLKINASFRIIKEGSDGTVMPTVISVKTSLLENINLLQLADDTAMIAEDLDTLKEIFKQVLDYSKSKLMVANLEKTFYLELRKNTENVPLIIDNDTTIHPAKDGKYIYLGMLFIPTNNITEIIEANLTHRSFHIKKYFDWVEINETVSITIKLQVLDSCMFSAYLYGAETWWKIDDVAESILVQQRKVLKIIIGVKKGTSNDLIYIELDRTDIISRIRQT